MTHHLVGAAEIARMLGVTRQRVNELVRTAPDFPAPEAELSAGRIWARADVEQWVLSHRMERGGVIVNEVAGVTIVEPSAFGDLQIAAERFLKARAVLVDLRRVDLLLSRRAVDFCSGVVYGRRGDAEMLSERLLLLTPARRAVDKSARRQITKHLAGEDPETAQEP